MKDRMRLRITDYLLSFAFLSRSEMGPRLVLLYWANSVVLPFLPDWSPHRDPCTSSSRQTPLSATMALKQPTALPLKVIKIHTNSNVSYVFYIFV